MKINKILPLFSIATLLIYIKVIGPRLTVGYERIPNPSEILDERINVLSGISFSTTGIPAGWSNLPNYQSSHISHKNSLLGFNGLSVIKDNEKPSLSNIKFFNYPILATKEVDLIGTGRRTIDFVQPFFDHSPFGGLIFMQTVKDRSSIEKLDPKEYRFIPTHILFWLNAVLLSLTAFLLTKRKITALFSFLIYTTAPSYVLTSRFALLENLVITEILLVLISLVLFKTRNKTFLISAGIFTGLCIATKESGIAALLMGTAILAYYKINFKNFLYFAIPAIFIGGIIYFYFLLLSPQHFLNIFGNQSGRGFFGSLNFIYSIRNLSFNNFPLDGYWIWGFISVFLLAYKNKQKEIIYGFSATLFTYLFFGGLNYPWYSLPFIPFLVLSSAIFITEAIQKGNIFNTLILFSLPFSSSLYWGYIIHQNGTSTLSVYRTILFISVAVTLYFVHMKKKMHIYKILIIILFFVSILLNIRSIPYIVKNWQELPANFSITKL